MLFRFSLFVFILCLLFSACRKQNFIVLERVDKSNPTPTIQPATTSAQEPEPVAELSPLPNESPFRKQRRNNGCLPCLPNGRYTILVQSTHDPISNISIRLRQGDDGRDVQEYVWGEGERVGLPLENLNGTFNANNTKWESPPLEFKAFSANMSSYPTPGSGSYRNDVLIQITNERGDVLYHSTANLMAHPPNWRQGNSIVGIDRRGGASITMVGSICRGNSQYGCQTQGRYPEIGRYKIKVSVADGGTIRRLFLLRKMANGDADFESFDVYQKSSFITPEFVIDREVLEFSATADPENSRNITLEVYKDGRLLETVSGSVAYIRFWNDEILKYNNGTGIWPPSGFWTTYTG